MKSKIITSLVLILLMGIVVAGGISVYDREVSLSVEDKETLDKMKITSPEIDKLVCDDQWCRTCLHQKVEIECNPTEELGAVCEQEIGAGCIQINKYYNGTLLTDNQIKELVINETEKNFKLIAKTKRKRDEGLDEKFDEGVVIIR